MPAPDEELIRYDGRTLEVSVRPLVQIEARRGRRWRWFGPKGWWIHLSLFHDWQSKKFVGALSEAGVFLKRDPDHSPWVEEERSQPPSSDPAHVPSDPSLWSSGLPFS